MVEVQVNDALRSQNPAQVEIEDINTVQKCLVYARKHDICYRGELREESGGRAATPGY